MTEQIKVKELTITVTDQHNMLFLEGTFYICRACETYFVNDTWMKICAICYVEKYDFHSGLKRPIANKIYTTLRDKLDRQNNVLFSSLNVR